MKQSVFFILVLFSLSPILKVKGQSQFFKENLGQVGDQYNNPRPDVLFSLEGCDMGCFLKRNGASYQLYKPKSFTTKPGRKDVKQIVDSFFVYRIDIDWVGANENFELKKIEHASHGYDNYFLPSCSSGIYKVGSYNELTYVGLYDKIDLRYYNKGSSLKYDFIVHPGGDHHNIKLKVSGAQYIKLLKDGSLQIKTPFGDVIEGAPIVFQGKKRINANWRIKSNVMSFEIGSYDHSLPLIIDPPVRSWGTYYGGSGDDRVLSTAVDPSGNVFISGVSSSTSNIATVGAFMTVGGGGTSAFLAKFNAAGIRQWGTYYGGSEGNFCATDASGNVYMCGSAIGNSTLVASPGSHQPNYGGGFPSSDAYLVKFDPTGIRLWGTYYGGSGIDIGRGCCTDASGNVFLCGQTASPEATVIATLGSHQATHADGGSSFDGFIVKFNSSGVRQWGTYYGGTGTDFGFSCSADPLTGNVFLAGHCNSTSGTVIATPSSHQPTLAGSYDGFLVQFNANGVRQWGTYYGGTNIEDGYACAADGFGNIFFCGGTNSTGSNVIASAGAHQTVYLSSQDAFLVKFNSSGVRQWGTYFGEIGADRAEGCFANVNGDCFITGPVGGTPTNPSVTTAGAHMTAPAGLGDSFLAKFNASGTRVWGTYYGGNTGQDHATSCAESSSGEVYVGGWTATPSGTGVATPGSHQPAFVSSVYDGFLAKLIDCNLPPTPSNITPTVNRVICTGNSATLSVSGAGPFNWYSGLTSTNVVGTGSVFATPVLTVGFSPATFTFFAAMTNTCGEGFRTSISVTVNPSPTITVNSGSICPGQIWNISPQWAVTYSYSCGASTVIPLVNTNYTVIGYNNYNCPSAPVLSSVAIIPPPSLTITSSPSICLGQSVTISVGGGVTYSWNTGATTSTITDSPTSTTSYTVTGYNNTSPICSSTAVATVSVVICAGLNEVNNNNLNFEIYPNPNSGSFFVSCFEECSLKLYNSIGQLVIEDVLLRNENKIVLPINSCGVYLAELTSGEGVKRFKVIVE